MHHTEQGSHFLHKTEATSHVLDLIVFSRTSGVGIFRVRSVPIRICTEVPPAFFLLQETSAALGEPDSALEGKPVAGTC